LEGEIDEALGHLEKPPSTFLHQAILSAGINTARRRDDADMSSHEFGHVSAGEEKRTAREKR
jgi:hypothetical protein